MTRYRLVTRTTTDAGTEEHVSSVIQTLSEILQGMEVEEQLAEATGWTTAWHGHALPYELVCLKDGIMRTLTYRGSTPFDDTL